MMQLTKISDWITASSLWYNLIHLLFSLFPLLIYLVRSQKWHPDKHKGDVAATAIFQEINEAYSGILFAFLLPCFCTNGINQLSSQFIQCWVIQIRDLNMIWMEIMRSTSTLYGLVFCGFAIVANLWCFFAHTSDRPLPL